MPRAIVDADLAEIDAAIALVALGLATRVRLVGLAHAEACRRRGPRPCAGVRSRLRARSQRERRGRCHPRAARPYVIPGIDRRRSAEGADRSSADRPTPRRPAHPGRTDRCRRTSDTRGPGRSPLGRPPATRANPLGRVAARTRRLLFGRPLASDEEAEERLSIPKALAVFSSDNLSSVAYATEAIMFTLLAAGTARLLADHPDLGPDRRDPRRSSSSPTARRSGPTRAAAAATSSPRRTSGPTPGWSPPRRSWSTTS